MKIVLASKNPHKLVEINEITKKFGFELVLQSELGVDLDVEENGMECVAVDVYPVDEHIVAGIVDYSAITDVTVKHQK